MHRVLESRIGDPEGPVGAAGEERGGFGIGSDQGIFRAMWCESPGDNGRRRIPMAF